MGVLSVGLWLIVVWVKLTGDWTTGIGQQSLGHDWLLVYQKRQWECTNTAPLCFEFLALGRRHSGPSP